MTRTAAGLTRALAAAVAVALTGCGGGSSPSAPSTPRPTPAPTPTTIVVRQNSFTGLDPDFLLVVPFTTTTRGDLEAVADWTFATNNLDLVLVAGTNPCSTPDGIDFSVCSILFAEVNPTTKPERLRAPSLAAGAYTLYIGNNGPGEESLSYQILLTYTPGQAGAPGPGLSSAAGAAPALAPESVAPWRASPR